MKKAWFSGGLALAAAALLALTLSCCGNGSVGRPPVGRRDGGAQVPALQRSMTLDEALADLDALPVPECVDEAVFSALKSALREALLESVGRVPGGAPSSFDALSLRRGTSPAPYSSSSLTPAKVASRPPTGPANRVDDLMLIDNGDGTYTLTWSYRNVGDYNQDGIVNIMDITPLAAHFNEPADATNEWIDGNADSAIDIKDVTPLAANFFCDVAGYAVEGAPLEGDFAPLTTVPFSEITGTGEGRGSFAPILTAGEIGASARLRVVPVDSWGEQGIPSNEVELPVSAPEIHSVTPTEWFTGEECTFTAAVSGTRPLNFSWDFGSGADPNEVTGSGDEVIAEVILGEPGEYEAELSVSNLYGEDTCPFTLTVAERESWAHTWGGDAIDYARDAMLDDAGNLWVTGRTVSFGAGSGDVILLKYDPEGELLLSKTWGGGKSDGGAAVAVGFDGSVYVAGNTESYGAGESDVLLVKYNANGDLLWAKTWGGTWIERTYGMACDCDGNIYVVGERSERANADTDIFFLKYDDVGALGFSLSWGGSGFDFANGIRADSNGSVYVVGSTESFGAGGYDALVLEFASDGKLQFGATWGGDGEDRASGVAVDVEGSIYVVGRTKPVGKDDFDGFILSFDGSSQLLWSRKWGGLDTDVLRAAVVDRQGRLFAVGYTTSFGSGAEDVVLLVIGRDGILTHARAWGQAEWDEAASICSDGLGNVHISGWAPNAEGDWQDISTAINDAEGVTGTPDCGAEHTEEVESAPQGSESTPDGIVDAGGGDGMDVLVTRNFPR